MKNLLLGIIAINLTFISFNLALRSIEPVQASASDIKRGLNGCNLLTGPNWTRTDGRDGGFYFDC